MLVQLYMLCGRGLQHSLCALPHPFSCKWNKICLNQLPDLWIMKGFSLSEICGKHWLFATMGAPCWSTHQTIVSICMSPTCFQPIIKRVQTSFYWFSCQGMWRVCPSRPLKGWFSQTEWPQKLRSVTSFTDFECKCENPLFECSAWSWPDT